MKPTLLIVTGLPATGKTSICKVMSEQLSIPVFSKDVYKEILFDCLGTKDRDWSKKLGKAAIEMFFNDIEQLLKSKTSVIAETNFKPEFDNTRFQEFIDEYNINCIQIICKADGEILYKRFADRAQSGGRHGGHNDSESLDEFRPILMQGRIEPLDISCEIIEVDTTDWSLINFENLISQIKEGLIK
jgi:predicted kinase